MTPGDLSNDAVNKARQIEQHVSLIYWFTFDCTGMVFVDHTFYMLYGWNQGAPFRGLHPGVSSRILGFIPSWIGRTTTLTLNSMNMGTYMYVYIQYIYNINKWYSPLFDQSRWHSHIFVAEIPWKFTPVFFARRPRLLNSWRVWRNSSSRRRMLVVGPADMLMHFWVLLS